MLLHALFFLILLRFSFALLSLQHLLELGNWIWIFHHHHRRRRESRGQVVTVCRARRSYWEIFFSLAHSIQFHLGIFMSMWWTLPSQRMQFCCKRTRELKITWIILKRRRNATGRAMVTWQTETFAAAGWNFTLNAKSSPMSERGKSRSAICCYWGQP